MRVEYQTKLDYDDVLIRPKRSEAPSRLAIGIERTYRFLNSRNEWRGVPIIASNMDTVGTVGMARALGPSMMTCLHKHHTVQTVAEALSNYNLESSVFVTTGIGDEDFEKLNEVVKHARVQFICVDVANGYTTFFVDRVKCIREAFQKATIMAGNVATPEMVQELLVSGAADIVKIGIGPGSVCTTRTMAAIGYPQLSAVMECADAAHGLRGHVCADGGCRTPGDVVKAFAAGADFVMLGGMLAGHDECEGEWVMDGGKRVGMKFYGMASEAALNRYAGGRGDYRACEGRETIVSYKGSVKATLQQITGGIRSACAYVGAAELKELSKCTTFVVCSRPHHERFAE